MTPTTTAVTPQPVDGIKPFPVQTLTVVRRNDPVLESLGHDFQSAYADRFWLPILGPSTTALARIFDRELTANPSGFTINCDELAYRLGLGRKGGAHGPLWRSLQRACRFNIMHRNASTVVVLPKLAPLTVGQVSRLPEPIQTAHNEWAQHTTTRGH